MPWFRFIDELNIAINYRNGRCVLCFSVLTGEDVWAWVARREGTHGNEVILIRRGNTMALHQDLHRGFEVAAGSPAEAIMRHIVKLGKAEQLPDDEKHRRDLEVARGIIERDRRRHETIQRRLANPNGGQGWFGT